MESISQEGRRKRNRIEENPYNSEESDSSEANETQRKSPSLQLHTEEGPDYGYLEAQIELKISTLSTLSTKLEVFEGPVLATLKHYLSKVSRDAGAIAKYTATQGDAVELLAESTKITVGYGIVAGIGGIVHGVQLPPDCLRVSVDEIVDGSALLPVPIAAVDMKTVADARKSYVAWPSRLVKLRQLNF